MARELEILMKDPSAVEGKIKKLVAGGAEALKVISDFDFTVSKFWWDDAHTQRACSCYKLIEDCGLLDATYHDKAQALQQKYYPMEVDPNLPKEAKLQAMLDWVTAANELLHTAGMTKDMLPTIVRDGKLKLRDGTDKMFALLVAHNVPTLLFSGGIANVLEAALQHNKICLSDDIHIISNTIIWGEDGSLKGWSEPHFHAFNKLAQTVADKPFMKESVAKKNVLLFGDSLGDIKMSDGLDMDCILTVGFLNDKVDERLEEYKALYDVVILGDPSLDYHIELLEKIFGR